MAGSGTVQLRDSDDIVLRVENLVMEFPAGLHQVVHAVPDVSFDVRRGETLGIVGESGCGKSTTARALVQLPTPTSGTVVLDPGVDGEVELTDLDGEGLRCVRPRIQMIFQDPISSLNPRRRVKDIVGEGLAIWRDEHPDVDVAARVDEVLGAVGLDPVVAGCRRPYEFSGGQCQRISIARALAIDPEILICDEPVSALDVSVQAQILNILEEMKERFGLTLVFISHDLSVVRNVSDRVVVMYLGKICEIGERPLPDLPKCLRNRQLGLRTRHGDERRFTLKLKNVLSLVIIRELLLIFLAFSENDPLPYRPNFPRNG